MTGLPKRLLNFLVAEDEAVDALAGAKRCHTISGSCGRALARGAWWGPAAVAFVNWIMRNPQHCQEAAADEARWDAETQGQL